MTRWSWPRPTTSFPAMSSSWPQGMTWYQIVEARFLFGYWNTARPGSQLTP
jgi:hypothetical protein